MDNYRALGLSLIAVFAMSAFLASGASAAEFHAEKAGGTLVGEQEKEGTLLGTETGNLTCKKLTFSGSYGESTTVGEISLKPSSSECTFAGAAATVHWNGCEYQETSNQTLHIKCPPGKLIEVTAPGCTTTWPPQQVTASVVYTNLGSGANRHVTAHVTSNSVIYEEHGLLCKNKTKLKANGIHNQSTTVRVESEGKPVGFWLE